MSAPGRNGCTRPIVLAMTFTLSINERPDYLHFKVTGENSEASVRGYLQKAHDMCIARQRQRPLVEEHLRGLQLGTLQMFQIASEGSVRSRSIVRKIAYVDTNPEHAFDDTKFVEDVAVNRGMNVRAFRTVAEAEQWSCRRRRLPLRCRLRRIRVPDPHQAQAVGRQRVAAAAILRREDGRHRFRLDRTLRPR